MTGSLVVLHGSTISDGIIEDSFYAAGPVVVSCRRASFAFKSPQDGDPPQKTLKLRSRNRLAIQLRDYARDPWIAAVLETTPFKVSNRAVVLVDAFIKPIGRVEVVLQMFTTLGNARRTHSKPSPPAEGTIQACGWCLWERVSHQSETRDRAAKRT